MKTRLQFAALASGLILCGTASAHSFGRLYNLPVPLWLYLYGAAAALALSFVLAAYFVTAPRAAAPAGTWDVSNAAWVRLLRRCRVMPLLQGLSVGLLLLCIVTGLYGNRNPYVNFNMTFFWIVFVLMLPYAAALLLGDVYETLNPWKVLAGTLGRFWPRYADGFFTYPKALGHWPAVALYMAFIWIELFGHTRPHSLSQILMGYTALNLIAAGLFGVRTWFACGELFAVFMRLMAMMAPLAYSRGRLALRWPFTGLLQMHATGMGLVVFVLFALSSTAFDGLRATTAWYGLFWADTTGLMALVFGERPIYQFPQLRGFYIAAESVSLLFSPFLYLLVYAFFMWLARLITRSPLTVYQLCLRFAHTLLPIALAYNITHYYTLILTQGIKIFALLSNPFGWDWDLFGTVHWFRAPILPDMNTVWHSQVGLILLGHIISVVLAHIEALRTFETPRKATLSQLPMLALMMAFTASGLWILGQPLTGG